MLNSINSKLLTILLLAVTIWLSLVSVKYLLFFFMPFIIAFLISTILTPLTRFVSKILHLKHKYSKFAVVVIFFLVVASLISLLVYAVITQLIQLGEDIPNLTSLISENYKFLSDKYSFLPPNTTELLSKITEIVFNSLSKISTTVGKILLGSLSIIPMSVFYALVTVLATLFITLQREDLLTGFYNLFDKNEKLRKFARQFKKDSLFVVGAYIKAQLIIMTVTFTISMVGLSILKVKYAILIALGTAILDALPIFGTGTVFIPWIITNLIFQKFMFAGGLAIIYVVSIMSRQAMEPKLISEQIGVNPLLTLLAIYTGFKLFGVVGIILGPITIITILAYRKY